jgi:dCTP diphosphatase
MSKQKLVDVSLLESTLDVFADKRNWRRFHSPKNLAMALTGEVGELVEVFQWLSEEQSAQIMSDEKLSVAVQDEIADVLIYVEAALV